MFYREHTLELKNDRIEHNSNAYKALRRILLGDNKVKNVYAGNTHRGSIRVVFKCNDVRWMVIKHDITLSNRNGLGVDLRA